MCSIFLQVQNPAHPLLLRGRGFDDLEIINVSHIFEINPYWESKSLIHFFMNELHIPFNKSHVVNDHSTRNLMELKLT